uniref:LITAF domain-containing protein n=1 Tax=Chromera velia CCMP2878 TaxID=1169474 RepID=A0A0G4IEH1_9ALVE|eukprot:Cvel_13680.t1-p1 / transcript=Cvel_13680.t1 / gene=Cvel_13680 / organism=Chromera_velia_CCMP2878 / gene_product=Cell death-inducing p53-target protein 1, putative / transcript_product=Cell death-inducing p53-target protein 1, putative / location=Cvel_scaffold945:11373-16016(+) / protein_length=617 / sequence_SO=supercontig / SO=protein_coding / is_pseudo=false
MSAARPQAEPYFGYSVERVEKEDVNQGVDFGDLPVQCKCPHCKRSITTHVDFENNVLTFTTAIACFCLLHWLSICILPFIWPLLQDSVHTCPQCLNTVTRQRRINLPSVREDVMTFRCGSCAMVLSRKYVLVFFVVLVLIVVFSILRWWLFHLAQNPQLLRGPTIDKKWDEFTESCGYRSYLGNPISSSRAFDRDFAGKTVEGWTGTVWSIHEGSWSTSQVYIRMWPSQYPRQDAPDLRLFFGTELHEQIAEVQPGQWVSVDFTFLSLGRRGQPHIGNLWRLQRAASPPEFVEMQESERSLHQLLGSVLGLPRPFPSFLAGQTGGPRVVRVFGGPPPGFFAGVPPGGMGEGDEEDSEGEEEEGGDIGVRMPRHGGGGGPGGMPAVHVIPDPHRIKETMETEREGEGSSGESVEGAGGDEKGAGGNLGSQGEREEKQLGGDVKQESELEKVPGGSVHSTEAVKDPPVVPSGSLGNGGDVLGSSESRETGGGDVNSNGVDSGDSGDGGLRVGVGGVSDGDPQGRVGGAQQGQGGSGVSSSLPDPPAPETAGSLDDAVKAQDARLLNSESAAFVQAETENAGAISGTAGDQEAEPDRGVSAEDPGKQNSDPSGKAEELMS